MAPIQGSAKLIIFLLVLFYRAGNFNLRFPFPPQDPARLFSSEAAPSNGEEANGHGLLSGLFLYPDDLPGLPGYLALSLAGHLEACPVG
jgi:hypothetical protein